MYICNDVTQGTGLHLCPAIHPKAFCGVIGGAARMRPIFAQEGRNMVNCLWVAIGGGLGAVGRYLLSLISIPVDFPLMTLMTNFLGAVVIGGLSALIDRGSLSSSASLLLKTGLCGGFTTFSTFSLEAVSLLERGRILAGGLYALTSVALCLAGVLLGRMAVCLLIQE
jgi:CrcB protein